jgi:hypothetical protein
MPPYLYLPNFAKTEFCDIRRADRLPALVTLRAEFRKSLFSRRNPPKSPRVEHLPILFTLRARAFRGV